MTCRSDYLRAFVLATVVAMLGACTQRVDMADLRDAVGDAPVVLLSTSSCGYCRQLRADLSDWGVDYVDVDVERESNGRRAYDLVNGRGVPILLVGDAVVHGYAPDRSRELLAAASLIPDSSIP
jgi:glutaredoxin